MSNPLEDIKAMAQMSGLFRDLAAYDLAYTKRDILLLQIALINDAHKPHLTPEKRQEALDALGKLEVYRDKRQAFIDDGKIQFAHVSKSEVTMIDAELLIQQKNKP